MEAIFLSQLLTQMRRTVPEDGLFPKSRAEQTFQEMLDVEYAKAASRMEALGLAEVIYRQLSSAGA